MVVVETTTLPLPAGCSSSFEHPTIATVAMQRAAILKNFIAFFIVVF
jgi:hypothetical protein